MSNDEITLTVVEDKSDSETVTASRLGNWITRLHLDIEEDHFKITTCELIEEILSQTGVMLEDFIDLVLINPPWLSRWSAVVDFLSTIDKKPSDFGVFQTDRAMAAKNEGDPRWESYDVFVVAHHSPEVEWFQGSYESAHDWFNSTYEGQPTSIHEISADLTQIAVDPAHPFSEYILNFLQFLVDNLRADAENQETLH